MRMKEIRQITGHTFANAQSNKDLWYDLAVSYHVGANILSLNIDAMPRGMLAFLTNTALSIELLLKAIIVAKGGIPRVSHDLLAFARDAETAFSKNPGATLEWLSAMLDWSGRYPVPNSERLWDHYLDNVQERHTIRERAGNTSTVRANRETFPSVQNCEKLWDLVHRKWDEIRIDRQETKLGTTADPSPRSG